MKKWNRLQTAYELKTQYCKPVDITLTYRINATAKGFIVELD
jgi:hypothetical protein